MSGKTQGSYAATYDYRFGDKLKSVSTSFPGETASVAYNYDGLGKRRVEQLGTTTLTWFRWLGWEESGEYTGTPGSYTIGAMQTGYVPGLATFAGSNPTTAEWRYHLTDHLGSVRQLTAQNKAALARYDYAPYGELMRSSGLPLTVGYTGHRWDPAIGQYFAPFRYYNPQTARWNMRDPLGFLDGLNMYAYVAGNPVNEYDPLGLEKWKCFKNWRWRNPDPWHGRGGGKTIKIFDGKGEYHLKPDGSWLNGKTPEHPNKFIKFFEKKGLISRGSGNSGAAATGPLILWVIIPVIIENIPEIIDTWHHIKRPRGPNIDTPSTSSFPLPTSETC